MVGVWESSAVRIIVVTATLALSVWCKSVRGSNFASRAAAAPALLPHLLPRPHGGTHEFTFALYGAVAPVTDPPAPTSAFANLTRAMQRFGVGNGFDPFATDPISFSAASKLGWPISFSPIQGSNRCFQVPGCENNMTVEQHSRLKILDDANVYSEIQFGEWGYYFTGLQPAKGGGNVRWWHAAFPSTTCNATLCSADQGNPSNKCCATCLPSDCGKKTNTTEFEVMYAAYATPVKDNDGHHLYGFRSMPRDKKEAYELYREYYNQRVAWITSVGDTAYSPMARVNSVTCNSNMEAYAALWNSEGANVDSTINAGLELQCGHANIAFAMARGGSRRFGKVWTVQPSGWGYGPTTEGCGPLHCKPKTGPERAGACTAAEMSAGATCRGAEASHSYSWYWRVWFHAWFAGAAKITEEGPAIGLFECDDNGKVFTTFEAITRHGRNAQTVLTTARIVERGVPLMPLGLVIDKYMGYNAGVGPRTNHWNVLPMNSHDLAFDDLLHKQLYVDSGLPDEELKTTPHGEIADVILSDANATYLQLYPVLLLVGEHDFSPAAALPARLLTALKTEGVTELLVQQYHVDSMAATDWAALKTTGKTRVVAPKPVKDFHPPGVPAISDADLTAIGYRYLPVVVVNTTLPNPTRVVSILWQVNAQPDGGFVVELSNEWGVSKDPCAEMYLDAGTGTATVTLQLLKEAFGAVEWITGIKLHEGTLANGSLLTVDVPPGNTSFVAFGSSSSARMQAYV